jgi:hypothetical protein
MQLAIKMNRQFHIALNRPAMKNVMHSPAQRIQYVQS